MAGLKNMKTDIRKQVIDKLKGNFVVTEIKKFYGNDDSELRIKVKFSYNGKEGEFVYTLLGAEAGIDETDFEERDNEDIYDEIHKWVGEHIKFRAIVKCDGKEI